MPEHLLLAENLVLELQRHFRFQWEPVQQAHVLLFPEGMIKLGASAGEIVKRIDGLATVGAIIADLERTFPGADLRGDVLQFLEDAHGKGWVHAKRAG